MKDEIRLTMDGVEYAKADTCSRTTEDIFVYRKGKQIIFRPIHKEESNISCYEIISFFDTYKNVVRWQGQGEHCGLMYKEWKDMALNNNCPIHSVRRNDGEVFTIGDEIKNGKIKKFYIWETQMLIETDRCNSLSLKYQEKVKPKVPLFTTSIDNVEIFKGDKYYSLQKGNGTFNWVKCRYALDKPYEWETAASKEKLNEYILNNKPIEVTLKGLLEEIEKEYDTSPLFTIDKVLKKIFKLKINL